MVTEECWLSGEADVSSVPLIYLLKNSCPAHSTVRIESTSDIANNRFSFELIDKYLAPHLFLHCRLGVCSADKAYSNRRGLKMVCIFMSFTKCP